MPSKKTIVSNVLSKTRLAQAIVPLRALLKSEITILAYHRILNSWDEEHFPFDVELISASCEDFAWQMEYVRSHYSPIAFRDVIAFLDGKCALPPRPLLVTFDDGFDDNYHHAFPILKRTGVPATIFLSTGYISGVRTFWYDWLCYLCNQPSVRRSGISFAGRQFPLGENFQLRRQNIAVLFAHVKRLPDDLLRQEIAKLESAMGVEYPQEGFEESHPLTWDQVREMSEAGIEFGSHAVTHPILTNLTDEQLHQELLDSKQKIEQEISKPVDVIAYPVGEAFAFSDKVIGAAKSVGYRLGASYLSGVNELKLPNQFELRRLHVERYTSRSDFQGMLAMPGLLA